MSIPNIGSTWKHKKGMMFKVLMITNIYTGNRKKYPLTVVYENMATGSLWSKPLSEWYESGHYTFIED